MPLPALGTLEAGRLQCPVGAQEKSRAMVWLDRSPPVSHPPAQQPCAPTAHRGGPQPRRPHQREELPATTGTGARPKATRPHLTTSQPSHLVKPPAAAAGGARPKTARAPPGLGQSPGGAWVSPPPLVPRSAGPQHQRGRYTAPGAWMTWGQVDAAGQQEGWGQCMAPNSTMSWEQWGYMMPGGSRPTPFVGSVPPWSPRGSPPSPAPVRASQNVRPAGRSPPHVVWCGPARPSSRRERPIRSVPGPALSPGPYVPPGGDEAAPRYSPTPKQRREREEARRQREGRVAAAAAPEVLPAFRVVPTESRGAAPRQPTRDAPLAKRGRREGKSEKGARGRK